MSLLRQFLILLVIAGLGYGGYYAYGQYYGKPEGETASSSPRRGGGGPAAVKTAVAGLRTLVRDLEAVGTTRAAQMVEIKPKADGTVVEIPVRAGARVEQGSALFLLDDDIQKADLAEAEANLLKAEQALERGQTLKQSRVMANATLEDLQASRDAARAQVNRARQRLDDRVIRAPFAGTPAIQRVDLGAQVSSDTVLTRLDDLSTVLVEVQVPEEFFSIIKPGLEAEASTAAWPGRTFTARVSEIDTYIDPVSRSFRVRAGIDNPDGALASGMFMRLALQLSSDGVVMIPEESVVIEEGSPYLFVVKDGKAERRNVKTGGRQPGWVQITDGIEPGDEVISSGTSKVRAGGAVKVVSGSKPGDASASASGAVVKPAGATQ